MKTKRNLIQVCLLGTMLLALPAVVHAQQGSTLTNISSFKPFVGLGYSPFTGIQTPNYGGTYPTVAEITYDLTNSLIYLASEIRTFGMDGTLSNIAGICNTYNIKCFPCAYLSTNLTDDTNEINALIAIGNSNYPTTRGLIVGTEALQAGYDSQLLISNINYVRAATYTNVPVGTADVPDSLLTNQAVVSNSDFVMINPYAYWAQISITNAAAWTIQQWQSFTNSFPGKRVLIGEANWPTDGENSFWTNPAVVPSVANQSEFLSEFISMANSNGIEYFIFEYRDEPWKIQEEIGTVEQNWGIIDTNNIKKQSLVNYLSADFSLTMLSAQENTANILVQTYAGNPYSLFGTTNLLGSWGNPITNFTGALGTNQTVIATTNTSKLNTRFYKALQNF
jgi:exo-beta-1,3-glucanase (GH17 family)